MGIMASKRANLEWRYISLVVNNLVSDSYGKTQDAKFRNLEKAASKLLPGGKRTACPRLNNGNRTILCRCALSGMLIGQSLHTTQKNLSIVNWKQPASAHSLSSIVLKNMV